MFLCKSLLRVVCLLAVSSPVWAAPAHTYDFGQPAAAAKATRFLLLTDVTGVLDKAGNLIAELTVSRARELIADGTISGGMIPKIETCISAIEGGLEAAVIIDGRVPHALLLEIFTTHGVGTLIRG